MYKKEGRTIQGEFVQLTCKEVLTDGSGLCVADDVNKVFYVPNVLPGEVFEAQVGREDGGQSSQGYYRAPLLETRPST